jgi:hypothetical protein
MKKGQAQIFRILVVAAVVILLLWFGWRGISQVSSKGCESRLAVFEAQLKATVRGASSDVGSREEWENAIPCNVDTVLFVDKSKDVSFSVLDKYPEVYDTISPIMTDENTFLLKSGKVVKSFDMGDIHIDWPYYDCYITSNGRIDAWIEGHGDDTKFLKIDDQFDCTFDQENSAELSTEDLEKLLDDIEDENVGVADAVQLDVDKDITDDGSNTVIVIDTPPDEGKYFQQIPKCAVESFSQAVADGDVTVSCLDGLNIVIDDPLVVWPFAGGTPDCTITIDEIIEESCKREFLGAAFEDSAAVDNIIGDDSLPGYVATDNPALVAAAAIDATLLTAIAAATVSTTTTVLVDEDVGPITNPIDVSKSSEEKLSVADKNALDGINADTHFIALVPLNNIQLNAIIESDLPHFVQDSILSAQVSNTPLSQSKLKKIVKDSNLNDWQISPLILLNMNKQKDLGLTIELHPDLVRTLGEEEVGFVNQIKQFAQAEGIMNPNVFEGLLKEGRNK